MAFFFFFFYIFFLFGQMILIASSYQREGNPISEKSSIFVKDTILTLYWGVNI